MLLTNFWQMSTTAPYWSRVPYGYPCAICGKHVSENIVHQSGRSYCDPCFVRMEDYQHKVERRYERLVTASERAMSEYHSEHDRAHQMASVIPFGQPILVGHHSEHRDRRYRERIRNTYDRAFKAMQRAEKLKERAKAAEHNRAISSDDPSAVIRLREKLSKLEELQSNMVRINKVVQKLIKKPRVTQAEKDAKQVAHIVAMNSGNTCAALNANFHEERRIENEQRAGYPALAPELARLAEISEKTALALLTPDFCGRVGFPDYATKNNGAEIRRLKARIEDLLKQAKVTTEKGNEEFSYTGRITLTINREDNRVQIEFPGKPIAETIKLLKSYGFRWAPSSGCWQRQLNTTAIWNAETILEKIGATKE